MKTIARLVCLSLLLCLPGAAAYAEDAQPSDASLRKLLEVTEVKGLIEGMFAQMDDMVKGMTSELLAGKQISAEQQKSMDEMQARAVAIMKEELSWQTLEPLYIKVYKDSFTQSEVDSMLTFYSSPGGQAVIRKLPLVMQNSMTAMQERMVPIMRKVEQMAREAAQEIEKKGQDAQQKKTG